MALRWLTAGESHGEALVGIIEGVPAAGVVAEAMVALVLAEAALEKFGGDSIGETRRNMDSYLEAIPASLAWESNVAGWDA